MQYHSGAYRVNAGFFRDDFRTCGYVLPYTAVDGGRNTENGCIAVRGFLEARGLDQFKFSMLVRDDCLTLDWVCKVADNGDVRDIEGELRFVLGAMERP